MSSGEEGSDAEELPSLEQLMSVHTKADLSQWLEQRSLPKSGRSKEVLAKRVLRHMKGQSSSDDSDSDGSVEVGLTIKYEAYHNFILCEKLLRFPYLNNILYNPKQLYFPCRIYKLQFISCK